MCQLVTLLFCRKQLQMCDWKWLLYLETCQTHDQTKAQEFYLPTDTILLICSISVLLRLYPTTDKRMNVRKEYGRYFGIFVKTSCLDRSSHYVKSRWETLYPLSQKKPIMICLREGVCAPWWCSDGICKYKPGYKSHFTNMLIRKVQIF